ncbi:MAG: peptidoglycan editing factor PgeF [bacterium]
MFQKEIINSISYYTSNMLKSDKFIHAFTTRLFEDAANFTLGTGGNPENKLLVDVNRKNICEAFNLDINKLIIPDQKHTDNIKIVTSVDDNVSETDALITNVKNLPILLLFADCTPIILYSEIDNVIAVIHAGWRGTAKNIARKTVAQMGDFLGIKAENIKAAIGQAIGMCCYEVSQEVKDFLLSTLTHDYDNIIKSTENDKFFVDLKKINEYQLLESGVNNIDVFDICTSCESNQFFSYRAENGKTGRHGAIACLK